MKNILILEDDRSLQKTLQSTLGSCYNCTVVGTLEATYAALEHKSFELVIVDRVLPDGDGMEVISYLSEMAYKTRVLALSRKASISDRVIGLEAGADDYLPKPFALAELTLKVKKLLLMDKLIPDQQTKAGGFELLPKKGVLSINGKIIQLRKKESEILHCLMKYKNSIVTREMLITDVWSGSGELPTDTTLDVYIRRIRVLLGEYSTAIATVRGFGYRFIEQSVART